MKDFYMREVKKKKTPAQRASCLVRPRNVVSRSFSACTL